MPRRVGSKRAEVTKTPDLALNCVTQPIHEIRKSRRQEQSDRAGQVLLAPSSADGHELVEAIPVTNIIFASYSWQKTPALCGNLRHQCINRVSEICKIFVANSGCRGGNSQQALQELTQHRVIFIEPIESQHPSRPCAHAQERPAVRLDPAPLNTNIPSPVHCSR